MTAVRFVVLVFTRIVAIGTPVQALLGAILFAAGASAAGLPLAPSVVGALALAFCITFALQVRLTRAARAARTVSRRPVRRSEGAV